MTNPESPLPKSLSLRERDLGRGVFSSHLLPPSPPGRRAGDEGDYHCYDELI
jgi:hypothetical protein